MMDVEIRVFGVPQTRRLEDDSSLIAFTEVTLCDTPFRWSGVFAFPLVV